MGRLDWADRAACKDSPEDFFPPGSYVTDIPVMRRRVREDPLITAAKKVCEACPVCDECLAEAMSSTYLLDGIWGGTTALERSRMIRRDRDLRRATPVELPGRVAHGTESAYGRHGCRCEACRAGESRRYRRRTRTPQEASA